MNKLFLSIFVVAFISNSLFAQFKIPKEEYSVYSSVLNFIYQQNFKEFNEQNAFVIINETFKPTHFSEEDFSFAKGLNKDFKNKNQTEGKLEYLFKVKNYLIIKKIEIEKLTEPNITKSEIELFWENFEKKSPKSNGYYQFSRIGFSLNKKYALVKLERNAPVSGEISTFILRKTKRKWEIYSVIGVHSVA